MSDHQGAALIYPMLPDAETIIADKGYDCDAFREALAGALHSTASQAPVARNTTASCGSGQLGLRVSLLRLQLGSPGRNFPRPGYFVF
jgi:hypothetical protein